MFRNTYIAMVRGISIVAAVVASCLELAGQSFTEFSLPRLRSGPNLIVAGPDRALWFTEYFGNAIGRFSMAAGITEYRLRDPALIPWGIAVGPDGNVWYTASAPGVAQVGRITPEGRLSEFPLPDPNSAPNGIVTGPDGALWFGEAVGRIGRITTTGVITEFDVPTPASGVSDITAGPDGNLWFLEANAFRIGSITTAGTIEEHLIPRGDSLGHIAAGPDGALWFTDVGGQIFRYSPAGEISQIPLPSPTRAPLDIVAGTDGNLWIAEAGWYQPRPIGPPFIVPGAIARMTPTGVATEFLIASETAQPAGIAIGPDGNIWFTQFAANSIVRLTSVGLPVRVPRQVHFR